LVYVVEDWETIEEYAGDKQGFYQVLPGGEGVEIRVAVGRLGFKKSFKDSKDPLLDRIIKFCGLQNYVKVSENIVADYFFR
jgi:hypothetical protein